MEFIKKDTIGYLSNPGCVSRQLLSAKNAGSQAVCITEVHLEPGYIQPRHYHEHSEQIWYALQGEGMLLLANETEHPFAAGDVARFEAKDIHGLRNTSDKTFIYIGVTSPPQDFRAAYSEDHEQ